MPGIVGQCPLCLMWWPKGHPGIVFPPLTPSMKEVRGCTEHWGGGSLEPEDQALILALPFPALVPGYLPLSNGTVGDAPRIA